MKTYAQHNRFRRIALSAILTVAGGFALLTSCVDSKDPYDPNENIDPNKVGTLAISSLDREGDFVVKSAGTTPENTKLPDVDTFRVALLNYKTGEVVKNILTGQVYQWPKFSELSGQTLTIPAGKYKLEAANMTKEPLAEWDAPYYYGIKDITVRISDLSRETITCKLANVKVTVEYDEDFLKKVDNPSTQVYFDYTDPSATRWKADRVFAVGEKKAAYFKVPGDGKLYVKVTGIRKEDGKPLSNGDGTVGQTSVITGVAAMQWQKVKIKYDQTGQIQSSVTVDYSTIDSEHQIDIPDGDSVLDGGANNDNWEDEPSGDSELAIVGANFNGAPFDLANRLTVSVANLKNLIDVRFDASKGIDQLYVTIKSDALKDLLPELGLAVDVPFDIANPPAEDPGWVDMFANAEIGILDPNVPIKGKKTHKFAVGGLMSLLGSVAQPATKGPAEHKFGLKMVDAAGAVKEATLSVYLTE